MGRQLADPASYPVPKTQNFFKRRSVVRLLNVQATKNAQEEGLCPTLPPSRPRSKIPSIQIPSPLQLKEPATARPNPSQPTIEIFASKDVPEFLFDQSPTL